MKMFLEMAYLGLTEDEMRKSIHPFINHIQYFVKKYIHGEKVSEEGQGSKGMRHCSIN